VTRNFILCKLRLGHARRRAWIDSFIYLGFHNFIFSFYLFFPNQYHVFLIFNQIPWIDHTVDAIAVGTAADKFAAEDPDRRLELLWEILLN
jgi:hypothetical protein